MSYLAFKSFAPNSACTNGTARTAYIGSLEPGQGTCEDTIQFLKMKAKLTSTSCVLAKDFYPTVQLPPALQNISVSLGCTSDISGTIKSAFGVPFLSIEMYTNYTCTGPISYTNYMAADGKCTPTFYLFYPVGSLNITYVPGKGNVTAQSWSSLDCSGDTVAVETMPASKLGTCQSPYTVGDGKMRFNVTYNPVSTSKPPATEPAGSSPLAAISIIVLIAMIAIVIIRRQRTNYANLK